MMKIKEAILEAVQKFSSLAYCSPKFDACYLMQYILDKDLTYITVNSEFILTSEQLKKFEELVNKRASGYPIAYITNRQPWWEFNLYVNENVLIPRQETFFLVSESITAIESISSENQLNILELGTGSGAIILALCANIKAKYTATDISFDAIEVAKKNYFELNNDNKLQSPIDFIQSSWFEKINSKFDIIISNPPYISIDDPNIEKSVAKYEPDLALYADKNGLSNYIEIITEAPKYLNNHGIIILEHGCQQADEVKNLLKTNFDNIKTIQDFSGKNRLTMANLI